MNTYHLPLRISGDRSKNIAKAVEADEGCIAVGGLAVTLGQLCPGENSASQSPETFAQTPASTGLAAIARLVQLARREARKSIEQFAPHVGLTVEELQALELATVTPEPRVLFQLSEALSVSYPKMLSLAGHTKTRDQCLEQEGLRFAASSAPMDKLSKTEAQALHDFLRILHD